MELSDLFTFEVPGAKFQAAVKNRFWDGKIRLLNYKTREIYCGLAGNIAEYAKNAGYTCEIEGFPYLERTDEELEKFVGWLNASRKPRPYQLEAFKMAIRETRRLFISPTASGKSFMIYLVAMYITQVLKKRVLIVVPSTQLVSQLRKDFVDYNNGIDDFNLWEIRDGGEKRNDADIVISTWQAIQNQPATWYKPFKALIGDEVHTFKAMSLKRIAERCDAPYRLGFTGTLDGEETNELVLQGLFGFKHQVTTYRELRDAGYIADPRINCLILKHPDQVRKESAKATYQDESKIIATSEARRIFLENMISKLKGNVLCLYKDIDNHLIPSHESMVTRFGKDRVFKIHGSIKTDAREVIRELFDNSTNAILNASYGTCQQGISIINVDHIVYMFPTKSRIRLLQSMGRGLRRSETKTKCDIWDVADDLSWKTWKNHTLRHMKDRVAEYNNEEFDYRLFTRDL